MRFNSILLVLFILVGCSETLFENIPEGSKLRLSGVVNTSNSQSTRAGYFSNDGDADVEKLCMLVFAQSDGGLVDNIPLNDVLLNDSSGSIDVEIEGCKRGEGYFIRLVANMEIADTYNNYSDISALVVGVESNDTIGVRIPLVMISDSIAFQYDAPKVALGKIELKRKAARIVIHYDNIINSIEYARIEGTLSSMSLFGKHSPSSITHTIEDKSVGLGGKEGKKTAYYYVYPNSGSEFKLVSSIDGRQRESTIYAGIESNKSYSFRFNYNTSVEDYSFDPALTSYDSSKSEFIVKGTGDVIELTINENCTIEQPDVNDWLSILPITRASSQYRIAVSNNYATPNRSATIIIKDIDESVLPKELTITQSQSKYMVVVVGGQSNACGADESVVHLDGVHKTNPRTVQLSYRRGVKQPNLDIVPLTWCVDDMYDLLYIKNVSGLSGAKGIHQPLAKQLLERFSTTHPDYDILVVPAGFSGTAFALGNTPDAYDPVNLHPSNITKEARMRWGKDKAFEHTMIDRLKHVLNLNKDNKLVGFVWCQGESDRLAYQLHNSSFNEMTANIFEKLNASGVGARTAKGVVDKDSWYVFSSTVYYADYYLPTSASHVFAGYKSWNPSTFMYIEPKDEYTNLVGGNGAASTARNSHYGNDSYRTVVAPMVINCMDENGSLFNGKTTNGNRFRDATTPAQAHADGGGFSDEDVSSGLIVHCPFSDTPSQELVGGVDVLVNGAAQIVSSVDHTLVDINRKPRSINALEIDGSGKGVTISGLSNIGSFTASLMLKRTGNFDAQVQRILSLVGSSNTSVLEYKALTHTTLRRPELMFEPVLTLTAAAAVVAQFTDAITLRSEQEWCHILITHDAITKTSTFYLNGFMINSRMMASLNSVNFNKIIVGEDATIANGARGEISNLMVWNRVLTSATVRKLFLINYYGFVK